MTSNGIRVHSLSINDENGNLKNKNIFGTIEERIQSGE